MIPGEQNRDIVTERGARLFTIRIGVSLQCIGFGKREVEFKIPLLQFILNRPSQRLYQSIPKVQKIVVAVVRDGVILVAEIRMVQSHDLIGQAEIEMILLPRAGIVPGTVQVIPVVEHLYDIPGVYDIIDVLDLKPRCARQQDISLGIAVAHARTGQKHAVRPVVRIVVVIVRIQSQPVMQPESFLIISLTACGEAGLDNFIHPCRYGGSFLGVEGIRNLFILCYVGVQVLHPHLQHIIGTHQKPVAQEIGRLLPKIGDR